MYCKKCGAQIKKGGKVCQKCGTPTEPDRETEVPGAEKLPNTAAAARKKRHTKIFIVIAVIIAVIMAAAVVVLNRKPTIDLNKYTTVTFQDYDGQGEAIVTIDYGAIDEDYAAKVKVTVDMGTKIWFGDLSVGEVLPYLTSVTVDPDSGLSNGDQITVSYQTKEEKMKEMLDCKIKCREETIPVEGLEEIQVIDMFAGVEVDFSGTAPCGKAEIKTEKKSGQILGACSWEIEPDTNLSNGDTVTVSLEVFDESAFMQEFGGMPKETSRTFTVEGLDSYVTDFSQLSAENIEALRKEAYEQLEATCANTSPTTVAVWIDANLLKSESTTFADITLRNIYFLEEKDPNVIRFSGSVSMPVLLYSLTAKVFNKEEEEIKSKEIYFTVAFTDLVLEEGGNLVGIATNSIERYDAMDEAYKKWVTGKKDDYMITIYDENLKETDS